MECKTCKEKSKKSNKGTNQKKGETLDLNLIPQSVQNGDYNGNFFFKVIAFLAIIIVLPLIILVLLGQIFLTFFLPKSLPKVTKKFKDTLTGILTYYARFRHDREVKKREKQFKNTVSYKKKRKKDSNDKSEFDDLEIFEK
jgi:maltodextrin utilization protein YvdJ